MFDTLYSITITQAAAALRAGELTSAALVRHALEAVRLHDGTLNAMLHVSASALEEAERCDAEAAQGSFRGPLHGIPLVIKDNIDVRGLPTTVASPLFTHAAPAKADAVAVARLRAAGAVIFGKTNLDELAAHVSGRTSCFGPTVNPWHPERRLSPGGSSSGTAAAVAAGYCPGGLGTDTGGSIRLPAGWCGLYGIRSTQGQSDISGIYPRAASLDTVGAMARSARDIDLLLQILADPPLRDTLRASAPIRYLRIGVFPDLVRAKGSPEVIEAYAEAVGRWEEFGECIPVGLPLLDDPTVVDSVGTIRSYEFARDIRKDIEGNPFAGKMHPVPLADYKNGQQATPEAYHAALLHKQALSRQVDALKGTFYKKTPLAGYEAEPHVSVRNGAKRKAPMAFNPATPKASRRRVRRPFDTLRAVGETQTMKVKRCFSGIQRGLFTKSPLWRGMGRSPMYPCVTALSERPSKPFV